MKVRTGMRATLTLGIVTSLAANITAAHPSPLGWAVAAFAPCALLAVVEGLARQPLAGMPMLLSTIRLAVAFVIAGIAAWVSYGHMVEVALRVGETSATAKLLPISVDLLIVFASVSLIALDRTATKPATATATKPASRPRPATAPPAPATTTATAEPKSATAEKTATEKEAAVLEARRQNPTWTQQRIADETGVPLRSVGRYLAKSRAPTLTAVPSFPDTKEA